MGAGGVGSPPPPPSLRRGYLRLFWFPYNPAPPPALLDHICPTLIQKKPVPLGPLAPLALALTCGGAVGVVPLRRAQPTTRGNGSRNSGGENTAFSVSPYKTIFVCAGDENCCIVRGGLSPQRVKHGAFGVFFGGKCHKIHIPPTNTNV